MMIQLKTCLFLLGFVVCVTQAVDLCKFSEIETVECDDKKECILASYWCDGEVDCKDKSDEKHCDTDHECNPRAELDCGDGTCRPLSYRCDGESNCPDGRDEVDCPASLDLICDDGEVVEDMLAFRCDGYDDCDDGSDEAKCNAYECIDPVQVGCGKGKVKCIPNFYQCDSYIDCKDGSDEEDCE